MIKNQDGILRVFAFVQATGAPVTGDAANITCKYQLNGGSRVALADTNPTEQEDGYYIFNVLATENNGVTVHFYPESSTSGVRVICDSHNPYTTEANPGGTTLPTSSTQLSRVEGTEITAFINENLVISQSVYDSSLDPVDLSAYTLKFVISTRNESHVLTIIDSAINVSGADNNIYSLTIPDTLTGTIGGYQYSLRDASSDVVLAHGPLLVRYAATE